MATIARFADIKHNKKEKKGHKKAKQKQVIANGSEITLHEAHRLYHSTIPHSPS